MAKNKEVNTQTTDTLAERGKVIRVGFLPIYARPLTLLQVQEIGEEMEAVDIKDIEEKEYKTESAFVLTHPENAKAMANAVVKALFRKKWKRRLLGGYIKNHLTSKTFSEVYASIQASFDYNFFILGLIFLQGTAKKKEEKEESQTSTEGTKQATRPGQWSEV